MECPFRLTVICGVIVLACITRVQSSCDTLCSPGEFLSSSCVCLPCPNNTFTDKQNNESKCRPCKKRCEPSMVVQQQCNGTHDTVCACKHGKYLDPGILFCVDCTVCPAGSGAIKPCSTGSNTVCSPCIPGQTYSNIKSFTHPCTACRVCPAGFSIKHNCTNTTDTVCQLSHSHANTTMKTKTSTSKVVQVPSTRGSMAQETKKQNILMPLLISLFFLFVGILVCLGVWVYRSRARRRRQGVGHDSEDGEEVVPIKPKSIPVTTSRHGGLRGRHTRHLKRHDNNSRESDSQGSSTGSLQEDKPRHPDRLLRDLQNETLVIENLALLLNPKSRNNWVRLAGELGYSKTRVDNFGMQPTNATQDLLGDWRTMNSSTIGKLYGCLKKMKRDDACDVLECL